MATIVLQMPGAADGTPAADTIIGTDGNDTISGLGGNDTLLGGSGSDALRGGDDNDNLSGGMGNDELWGGTGADTLSGDDDNDVLHGDSDGADDIYDGGKGDDGLTFAGAKKGITIDFTKAGQGSIHDGAGGKDTFYSIENFQTTSHKDIVSGSEGSESIDLGAGDDTAHGHGGGDFLDGESGNDQLFGGSGNDFLIGGSGNDRLYGDNGDDELAGGKGNDKLVGGSGADYLYGEEGNDKLDGGKGNDLLDGGAGKDVLTGGMGNDTFLFDFTLSAKSNVDAITDFSNAKGNNDVFELDVSTFHGLTEGELSADAFHLGRHAADHQDRILYDQKHGDLYFDRDGSHGKYDAVKFAHLDHHVSLSFHDFLVSGDFV